MKIFLIASIGFTLIAACDRPSKPVESVPQSAVERNEHKTPHDDEFRELTSNPQDGDHSELSSQRVIDVAVRLKHSAKSAFDLMVSYHSDRPKLSPSAAYVKDGDTVVIEICEYIAYAGLLLANNGRAPNEDSFFFRNYGFKADIVIDETEEWDELNSGAVAASICCVDTPAAYGAELDVVCPLVFGFSRFDDGLIVRAHVESFSETRGQSFVTPHFAQSDYLLRRAAVLNGFPIKVRKSWNDPPDPLAMNLVYTTGQDDAARMFEEDLLTGQSRLIGFAGWDPYPEEVVQKAKGLAKSLTANRQPIVGADIQLVNRAFAEMHPEIVLGFVHGTLWGNRIINRIKSGYSDDSALEAIARGLTVNPDEPWTIDQVRVKLDSFDYANISQHIGFMKGQMAVGQSFAEMYVDAREAYQLTSEKAHNLDQLILSEPIEQLSELPPFDTELFRLESNGVLAKASTTLLDWTKIKFAFKSRIFDVIDMRDRRNRKALRSTIEFLTHNPQAIVTLKGYVDRSEWKQTSESEENAIKAGQIRAETVRKLIIERLKSERGFIRARGGGWSQEGEYVTVSVEDFNIK